MARKSSRPATSTAPVAEFRADSPEVLAIIAAKQALASQGPAAAELAEKIAPTAVVETVAQPETVTIAPETAPVSLANQLIALHINLSALVARLNECKSTGELAETQKAIVDCEGNIEAKRKEIEAEKKEAAKVETVVETDTPTIAPETAHSTIAKALPTITNQTELVALLSKLQSFKPAKPVFSSDKATRKGQMVAFKIADKSFRSALGKVYRHAEDLGWGVHADRHAASVTKTGIVTLRRSESLKIAPNGHRFSL